MKLLRVAPALFRLEPRVLILLMGLVVLLGLSGCGPSVRHYALVETKLAQQQFIEADAVILKHKAGYGKRNAVLYYLDRGMTLHLAGRYRESNQFLLQAEDRIGELYTRSVTTEAGAMLSNDNTLPYEGEDFEKVLINIIAALNYAYLQEWDEALVEARKVDHKLNLLNDRYEKKNIYKQDALAHYLSGILYESKREWNDAFISYRKAHKAYGDYRENYGTPAPPMLPADLLRVTAALHLKEEHRDILAQYPKTRWITVKEMKGLSEVIFVSYSGRSPVKEDYFIDAPIVNKKGKIYLLRVALPTFRPLRNRVKTTEIHLIPDKEGGDGSGDAVSQRAFLAENITAIAKKNLEDRVGRITVKAIARATAKYLASQALRKKVDEEKGSKSLLSALTELGTNIYSVASEQADKRSWRTLPDRIEMARIVVSPGVYTLAVEYYDETGGQIMRKTFPSISLEAGEKRFVGYRVLGQ